MTTRESIEAKLADLTEDQLNEINALIEQFSRAAQTPPEGETFLDKLQRIKIKAPPDFSTNWERYLSEEENAQ
jgi:hypothetical protein